MPVGVHLAVVDPGVGGDRKPLALLGGDGRLYVGPDNGLLLVAADRLGGVEERSRSEPAYRLEPVSPHLPRPRRLRAGRCPPAGGHRARRRSGRRSAIDELVRLELPSPEIGTRRIQATVLLRRPLRERPAEPQPRRPERVGIERWLAVEVEVGFERYYAVAARTFADVRPGDIVLYEDAYGSIALAINQGNAAEMFVVAVGQEIRLTALDA